MLSLRLRLRACTVLWLLCQTLSLAALVPADCCPAHHVEAADDCHGAAAPAATICPMHAPTGDECPMHAASASAGPLEPCSMQAPCDGPASALALLMSVPGVLAAAPVIVQVEVSVALVPQVPTAVDTSLVHDTPPPRA